jgi:hypothetical protein
MEVIIAMIFGAVVALLSHTTHVKPDCEKLENKPKACFLVKELKKGEAE